MVSPKIMADVFLKHLQDRDLESLVNLFSDEIEWQIPGNTDDIKWLGTRSSRIEVKEFFELLWSATEPVSAEVYKIFIDKSDVVITGAFVTKMLETNKTVSSIFFIHFVVEDSRIVKYTLLEDSYAVSKSLLK
ncbi:nuclear transport factor 2 family protein [Olivibacter sp. SDN3]|uniref:nuclear transport factor 2 family protein n=1 Tax=Olivibacter sp. SDN3 TaxID=2764720 RepID=UPI00165163FB|nr:nuclear transport factor 2 family protein [Olivibacter sp. SDN3]QNL51865.1 nuclear transport factor 2 family protein [Olivibacter sp. SDN3]